MIKTFNHKTEDKQSYQVSISSTFYVQIFCTNVVLAAFSSYVLALSKNLYKKHACLMLMKLTAGSIFFAQEDTWLRTFL